MEENKDKTIEIISITLLILGIIFIIFILPMRHQEAREKAFDGCMSLEKDYEYCKEFLAPDTDELSDY